MIPRDILGMKRREKYLRRRRRRAYGKSRGFGRVVGKYGAVMREMPVQASSVRRKGILARFLRFVKRLWYGRAAVL